MKNTNILDKIVGINKSLGAQLHKCIKKMVSVAKTSKGIAICSTFVVLVTLTVVSMVIIGAKKNDKKSIDETTTSMEAEIEATTEETTTKEETTAEETTEATTEEITIVSETTVMVVPETIPLEELSTVPQEEVETEDPKKHEEMATEPPTEKPTEPPKVSEVAKVVNGIDVSAWQGNIDWAKVKADGIKFAIIRVGGRSTTGKLFTDAKYEQNIENALANGMQIGIYSYSTAITQKEAREEASLVIGLIKKYKITYPVVFDWESYNSDRIAKANLSKTQLNNIAITYCEMIKAAGYSTMVYANLDHIAYKFNASEICSKYKVWLASYPGWNSQGLPQTYAGKRYQLGQATPSGKYAGVEYTYQMWQYTSQGKVNGISGNVDMNVAFFSFSGTEVPNTALQLIIKNKTVTTNIGTNVNLMNGISAYNTVGVNVTASVKYEIKNQAGTVVDINQAINTGGEYTVVYKIVDFTGASKAAEAKLIVRSKPTIVLKKSKINMFVSTDSGTLSTSDIVKAIQQQITTDVQSANDYEGNNLLSSVGITYPTSMYISDENGNVISNIGELANLVTSKLVSGKYTIIYTIKDSKNLTTTAELILNVIDITSANLSYSLSQTQEAGFASTLKGAALQNIIGDATKVTVSYNAALTNAIATKSFNTRDVYVIKYTLLGEDGEIYYRNCTVVIQETEETTVAELESEEEE